MNSTERKFLPNSLRSHTLMGLTVKRRNRRMLTVSLVCCSDSVYSQKYVHILPAVSVIWYTDWDSVKCTNWQLYVKCTTFDNETKIWFCCRKWAGHVLYLDHDSFSGSNVLMITLCHHLLSFLSIYLCFFPVFMMLIKSFVLIMWQQNVFLFLLISYSVLQ